MMHYNYEPYRHEQGNSNKSPLEQRLYSSTYMTGKIDQGLADNWQADDHCCHPKPKPQRLSPPSVRFHGESSVFLYEADEDEEDDCYSFFSPSRRSEEISFKTTTNRSIMACRQELVDAGEDIYASSNGIQRRDGRIKGFDLSEHLISSVSIRKNLEQILARKQVIRAVLDEQARQRQWNHFDPALTAMKSMEYSRVSVERARMIGFNNQESLTPSGYRDREFRNPLKS